MSRTVHACMCVEEKTFVHIGKNSLERKRKIQENVIEEGRLDLGPME